MVDWDNVAPDEIPFGLVSQRDDIRELQENMEILKDLENDISLPYIKKDVTLMADGTWNNLFYSKKAIKAAYKSTDWNNDQICALFLDHEDERTDNWVGKVKNIRLLGDKVVGDLEIIDKPTAIKLEYGAKFGISPKVKGDADNGVMNEFKFSNFSVVVNPACKKAWINNYEVLNSGNNGSQRVYHTFILNKNKKEDKKMSNKKEETDAKEEEQENKETKETKEETQENEQKKTEKKKKPEDKDEEEQAKKKKKYPNPEDKEESSDKTDKLSTEDVLSIVSNSAWTDFVKKMRKKYPKMSFKDIAKAFKKEQNKGSELGGRIDSLENKLDEVLTKVGGLTVTTEKAMSEDDTDTKDDGSKVEALKSQIKDLEDTLKEKELEDTEPEKKSVKLDDSKTEKDTDLVDKGYEELTKKDREKMDTGMAMLMLKEQGSTRVKGGVE